MLSNTVRSENSNHRTSEVPTKLGSIKMDSNPNSINNINGNGTYPFPSPHSQIAPNFKLNKFLAHQPNHDNNNKLMSFTMSGLDSALPFPKGNHNWDRQPFPIPQKHHSTKLGQDHIKNLTMSNFLPTSINNNNNYDTAAAKTMDLLGLSEGATSPFNGSVNLTAEVTEGSKIGSDSVTETNLENTSIKIENLSSDTTLTKLTNHVAQYGDIESIQLIKKEGVGLVTFTTHEEAKSALVHLTDDYLLNNKLRVQFYNSSPSLSDSKFNSGPAVSNSKPILSNTYLQTREYYRLQVESLNPSTIDAVARGSLQHERLIQFDYAIALPPIPNPNFKKRVDPVRLRELRKQLEGSPTDQVIASIGQETKESWIDLCSDYIGNIIIQKLMEFGTVSLRTALIQAVAPHMAAIGIHKNGTWAIQKMIEYADTDDQIQFITKSLQPFIPALLLDQFGNYVVQCCLKFESPHNQCIFDAIYARCAEIAQGRFGARAIRTCLDSQFTTPAQKRLVSESLMRNAYPLATNPNGSLLLNWVLDSHYTEHYLGMVCNLAPHLAQLCCHRMASAIITRLINQQQEMSARDYLIYKIFFQTHPGPLLNDILADPHQGNLFVQKLLNSPYLDEELRVSIQTAVNATLPISDHFNHDRVTTPTGMMATINPTGTKLEHPFFSSNPTTAFSQRTWSHPSSRYSHPFHPNATPSPTSTLTNGYFPSHPYPSDHSSVNYYPSHHHLN